MADQRKKSNRFDEIWKKEEPKKSSYLTPTELYQKEMGYDEIKEILETPRETFTEMLLRLMDEKEAEEPYLKDSDILEKARIASSHFSKIKNKRDYKPKKGTVISFGIALELSLDEMEEFLLKAGYGLSKSKKEDLVVRYFIEHKRYSIADIEETLKYFGLSRLGRI